MVTIDYRIDKNRIFQRLMDLAKIGKVGETGTHRFALSPEDKEAQLLVTSWMKEAGMNVTSDNFGNLIGRKEGTDPVLPVVMIGSHIDTVPNGGRFDGSIGVIGGIEVVQAIKEAKISHQHSIEVVAFCDEEGSRFRDGLFGSRGMIGQVTPTDLTVKDKAGISRYDALKSFGFAINPDAMDQSVRKSETIKVFLEIHIEQGPYLEKNDKSVGIVEGIAGPAWLKIQLKGEAGHAGTVPMNLRHDSMVGAAEVIKEIEMICKRDSTGTMVGTVGEIQAFPGGRNVIPDSVEFTLDIRDIDLERRNDAIQRIEQVVKTTCEKRGLTCTIDNLQEVNPVNCSGDVVQTLSDASKELELNAPIMISGAGHDAMFMAELTKMGMVFVRCRGGISHNPEEWASKEDIAQGTVLLARSVAMFIEIDEGT